MAAKLISFVCFLLFSKAFYLHIFWIPFPLSLLAFHIATLEAGAHNVGTSFPCFIISFRLGNLKRLKDSKVRLLLVLSGWALMVSCFFFFFACIIHKYSIERTSGFSTAYCSFRPSCTIGCLVAHKPSRSQSQLPPASLPASQTASTTGGGKHTHTHRHRDVGTNRTLNLFWVLIFRFKIVRFNGRPGRAIESSQAWSNRRTTGQTVSWPVGPPSSPSPLLQMFAQVEVLQAHLFRNCTHKFRNWHLSREKAFCFSPI